MEGIFLLTCKSGHIRAVDKNFFAEGLFILQQQCSPPERLDWMTSWDIELVYDKIEHRKLSRADKKILSKISSQCWNIAQNSMLLTLSDLPKKPTRTYVIAFFFDVHSTVVYSNYVSDIEKVTDFEKSSTFHWPINLWIFNSALCAKSYRITIFENFHFAIKKEIIVEKSEEFRLCEKFK